MARQGRRARLPREIPTLSPWPGMQVLFSLARWLEPLELESLPPLPPGQGGWVFLPQALPQPWLLARIAQPESALELSPQWPLWLELGPTREGLFSPPAQASVWEQVFSPARLFWLPLFWLGQVRKLFSLRQTQARVLV